MTLDVSARESPRIVRWLCSDGLCRLPKENEQVCANLCIHTFYSKPFINLMLTYFLFGMDKLGVVNGATMSHCRLLQIRYETLLFASLLS